MDSRRKRHVATADHMDFLASHAASNSTLLIPVGWLVCCQVKKGSFLISRLIHIPSELWRIEVWMWGIIINTGAVSPLHKSSRTLRNHRTKGSSNQTYVWCWETARFILANSTKFQEKTCAFQWLLRFSPSETMETAPLITNQSHSVTLHLSTAWEPTI